jgi:hypothetical protein
LCAGGYQRAQKSEKGNELFHNANGDFYFLLLRVAADLGAKSVKHQDKQTTLQNMIISVARLVSFRAAP